ncbi:transporter [Mesorhizobium sp. KR9-304]|uniref:transporter n=1 Tax=Mesorhizobium sp. KR9-304 TaxID=3156614 RepID=UPI0032B3939C
MPSSDDIQQYLTGAWRMMMGKADGLRLLDLTVDGFWNSFFAMVVALPALMVGWVAVASEFSMVSADVGSRFSIAVRFAAIDLAVWLLPIVVLAAVASRVGLADRFVHLVVASNWASALFIWLTVPVPLAGLIWSFGPESRVSLSLMLLALNLFVSWRVTNVAVAKGAAITTAVIAAMFVLSLLVQALLMAALGLGQAA